MLALPLNNDLCSRPTSFKLRLLSTFTISVMNKKKEKKSRTIIPRSTRHNLITVLIAHISNLKKIEKMTQVLTYNSVQKS